MKPIKIFLRYWFAITSVLSFLAGWIILAHSPKPVQPTSTTNSSLAPLPTLPPIQAFGSGNSGGSGLFSNPQTNSNTTQFFPRMRTGGS